MSWGRETDEPLGWIGGRPERSEPAARGREAAGPSVYEAVTRQMVDSMMEELREIRSRLNGLLFMVAGALVIDLALRLMGAG